jgi:hypothetical protein
MPRRLRALALALLVALAAANVSAVQAAAPADTGVRCAGRHPNGDFEFFMPGERVTDTSGNRWVCGPDGRWLREYAAILIPPTAPTPGTVGAIGSATLQR